MKTFKRSQLKNDKATKPQSGFSATTTFSKQTKNIIRKLQLNYYPKKWCKIKRMESNENIKIIDLEYYEYVMSSNITQNMKKKEVR